MFRPQIAVLPHSRTRRKHNRHDACGEIRKSSPQPRCVMAAFAHRMELILTRNRVKSPARHDTRHMRRTRSPVHRKSSIVRPILSKLCVCVGRETIVFTVGRGFAAAGGLSSSLVSVVRLPIPRSRSRPSRSVRI